MMPTTDKPTPCAENTVTFDLAAEGNPYATRDAKALCATCPIWAACLAEAMAQEKKLRPADRWGIYGGLTPAERARKGGVKGVGAVQTCGVCGLPIEGRAGRQLFHAGQCAKVANARRSQRNAAARAARRAS